MDFNSFFATACPGRTPYPYQRRLAASLETTDLLSVPTGLGKTAAVILGWLYRRRFPSAGSDAATPRRLVYCLPMRTLVEQTAESAESWLCNLGIKDIGVHKLLGGAAAEPWDEHPERDAILIGTQDMLLSRALNRGYGMSRYRWPVDFALLNNDCLWVMDETQLMGSGLKTTAQLAVFGEKLWPRLKPCQFLWMSATLAEDLLDTRDRRDLGVTAGNTLELGPEDVALVAVRDRLRAPKLVSFLKDCPKVSKVLDEHDAHAMGRLSLLVFNTVPAARKMLADLKAELAKPTRKKKGMQPAICLLHGRFRRCDRKERLKQLEDFVASLNPATGAAEGSPGLILVSTQVVEAGFDISSVRFWSEIAPWPSDVQRLGRLNREGLQPNAVATFWRPKEDKEGENKPDSPNAKRIGPYDKAAIDAGQKLLEALRDEMAKGLEYRDALDKVLATEISREALKTTADTVVRPDDLLQLFHTDPDLAGGFTNVSQFVRDADRNVDVQVFWRDFLPKRAHELNEPHPHQDELCSVPFFHFRRFLGDKGVAWEWSGELSRWETRRAKDIWPGMTLLLPLSAGGYSEELGWTGDSGDKPKAHQVGTEESIGLADDPGSQTHHWYPLSDHLADVELEMSELAQELQLGDAVAASLIVAARWHDWGKSHWRWQQSATEFVARVRVRLQKVIDDPEASRFHDVIARSLPNWDSPASGNGSPAQWAKFPDVRRIWTSGGLHNDDRKQLRKKLWTRFSPNMRHEAASALAAWDAWLAGDASLTALAVYLIASHHGKVRTVLRSTQERDEVFGLRSGDTLQPVPGRFAEEVVLQCDAKHLGAHGTWDEAGTTFQVVAPSWTEVTASLLGPASSAIPEHEPNNLGPFALAYLEAILVAADVRASKNPGKAQARQ